MRNNYLRNIVEKINSNLQIRNLDVGKDTQKGIFSATLQTVTLLQENWTNGIPRYKEFYLY